MGTLSAEDLAEIKKLAGLFFSPREVATMMGYDPEPFARCCKMRMIAEDIYDAYHGGKLEQEMILRLSIRELAKKGSTPAQTAIVDLINRVNAQIQDR